MVGRPCGQVRGESQASRFASRPRCSSGDSVCPAFTAMRLHTLAASLLLHLSLQGCFVLLKVLHDSPHGSGRIT